MKRANILLIAYVFACLTACVSNRIEDRYYALVLAASDTTNVHLDGARDRKIIVGPVEIPAYLDKRGIAIQSGPNQIQTAIHHLWAEPLADAIAKVLVRDLSQLAEGAVVEREAGRWNSAANCRLRIEFDRFHATSEFSVVASGRFWILAERPTVSREFSFTNRLSADGYAHAVAELRRALSEVAQVIVETMNEETLC